MTTLTPGPDDYSGTPGPDEVFGGDGDDTLRGLDGLDTLYGEAGNDSLSGGGGAGLLYGGDGDDSLSGGSGSGLLYGGDGDDYISDGVLASGGDGNDTIVNVHENNGGAGDDSLVGGVGDQLFTVVADEGSDTIDGGLGTFDYVIYLGGDAGVVLTAGSGSITVGDDSFVRVEQLEFYGGSGGDSVTVGPGVYAARLAGGAGDDTMSSGGDGWLLDGGADDDLLTAGSGSSNLVKGGSGDDTLDGGAGWYDTVEGGDGDDLITGGEGVNDVVSGGAGNDTILAVDSWDSISGDAGVDTVDFSALGFAIDLTLDVGRGVVFADDPEANGIGFPVVAVETAIGTAFGDVLTGSTVANALSGRAGNDTINGGLGADTLDGGDGIDRLDYEGSTARVVVDLAASTATGSGGFAAGDRIANFENVRGSEFNDYLSGDGHANFLIGRGGTDALRGLDGRDSLNGGAGDDTLTGGSGADKLVGRAGADRFAFTDLGDSTRSLSNRDTILDFKQADGDRIALSAIDANALVAGNQTFSFIGPAAFSGAAGELRAIAYSGYTLVIGDVNGDRSVDFAVRVDGSATLTAGDFIL